MKVWTCKDHPGYWPVGTASVIVAENEVRAYELMEKTLMGLTLEHITSCGEPTFSLQELDITTEQVVILCDGEY